MGALYSRCDLQQQLEYAKTTNNSAQENFIRALLALLGQEEKQEDDDVRKHRSQ